MLNKYLKIFIITLALVVIDQAIKWWMIEYYPLLIVKNNKAIFGLIDNLVISYWLLVIGLIVLIYLFIKTKNQLADIKWQLVLSLILAGVISNLLDRFYGGYIIDYLTIPSWSSFNLADIYILLGAILYLVNSKSILSISLPSQ